MAQRHAQQIFGYTLDDQTIFNLAIGGVYFEGQADQSQSSKFVFDTGSAFISTTSSLCTNCETQYYDYSVSEPTIVANDMTIK